MQEHTYKAIEDAVKGGYQGVEILNHGPWFSKDITSIEAIMLDSQFWQCLGKSRGWPDTWSRPAINGIMYPWKAHMHNLVDCLIQDGSIEDYFKSIDV